MEDETARKGERVLENVLLAMAIEYGLGAEEANRCLRCVITLNLNGVLMPMMIEDLPAKHTFSHSCVDAGEITNLGRTGRVRNEVFGMG